LLPDTVPLDPVLPEGWEAVTVDARAEIPAEHHDAAVLVVWGSSRRHLASAAESLEALQLVQSLSAGVDGILAAGFAEHVVIATGVGRRSLAGCEPARALLLRRPPLRQPAQVVQQQGGGALGHRARVLPRPAAAPRATAAGEPGGAAAPRVVLGAG